MLPRAGNAIYLFILSQLVFVYLIAQRFTDTIYCFLTKFGNKIRQHGLIAQLVFVYLIAQWFSDTIYCF